MHKEIDYILENIRLIRVQKGLTIDDVAGKSEVSRSNLYYIESKQKNPTLYTLYRLAKALDVDIKDFFQEPTKRNKPML